MNTAAAMAFYAILFSGAQDKDAGGGSTPEDCFEKAKAAAGKKDWKAMYALYDAESADVLLFWVAFGAGMSVSKDKDAQKELDALGTKYGIKKREGNVDLTKNDELKKVAKETFAEVKDKPGLFAELVEFVVKHDKDKKGANPFEETKNETLKDVKIDGDKASGTIERGEGKKTSPVKFIKRKDRWYFQVE